MTESPPILSVSNLFVHFSKMTGLFQRKTSVVKAVNDVSFEIRESEIVSLVGESGSGKTTIARCILALASPASGSIRFNGLEVTTLKGKPLLDYRRDVQLIFQDPFESLNPRLDVFTILAFPIKRLTGEKDHDKVLETVSRLLFEVELHPDEVLHKFPHQLSGGERQRVNIARALSSNPKLLIADEPITMLDASQRLNVLALLRQLKLKRKLTILLITHDLASAQIMSDRTMVMYLGKLVEIGPTKVVLSRPHHPYSSLILAATPRLVKGGQAFEEYGAGIDDSGGIERGCIFAPRCRYSSTICKETEPLLREVSNEHLVSCHNPLNTG